MNLHGAIVINKPEFAEFVHPSSKSIAPETEKADTNIHLLAARPVLCTGHLL